MLAPSAAWPQLHKQCFSDNASSDSSITECLQPVPQHLQQPALLRGAPHQGAAQKSHDYSGGEASDITGAQLPHSQSVTDSPTGAKASDTVTQRVSSRLRKRQRYTSDPGEHSAFMHAWSCCARASGSKILAWNGRPSFGLLPNVCTLASCRPGSSRQVAAGGHCGPAGGGGLRRSAAQGAQRDCPVTVQEIPHAHAPVQSGRQPRHPTSPYACTSAKRSSPAGREGGAIGGDRAAARSQGGVRRGAGAAAAAAAGGPPRGAHCGAQRRAIARRQRAGR
jgi:hypothetical protein